LQVKVPFVPERVWGQVAFEDEPAGQYTKATSSYVAFEKIEKEKGITRIAARTE